MNTCWASQDGIRSTTQAEKTQVQSALAEIYSHKQVKVQIEIFKSKCTIAGNNRQK